MAAAPAIGTEAGRRIWPVVLSGGSGTRLWPLSRTGLPKQFLALAGDETLIQATVARTADPARFHAPIIIGNEAHVGTIGSQLSAIGARPECIILEPVGRNTAPAIALAAHLLVADDPAATMLVMPSDHVIVDGDGFRRAVETVRPLVEEGSLATFGIRPTGPETGYGYIRFGEELIPGVHRVEQFVEKPDLPTAEAYVRDGRYVWNGGIFLMRADRYLAELEARAPAIHGATARAVAGAHRNGPVVRPEPAAFRSCPSDSIDYAVMEKAAGVVTVPVEIGWSDIGSWDALSEISRPDAHGSTLRGDVIALDTRGAFLRSEGPLIAAVGVSDLTVVATPDAVLVVPRGRSQDVKRLVDELKARGRARHLETPSTVRDSWGEDRLLAHTDSAEVRQLTLRPGAALDLHLDRRTRLTVLGGRASVIDAAEAGGVAQAGGEGSAACPVQAGSATADPGASLEPGAEHILVPGRHRIANAADEPLLLLTTSFA